MGRLILCGQRNVLRDGDPAPATVAFLTHRWERVQERAAEDQRSAAQERPRGLAEQLARLSGSLIVTGADLDIIAIRASGERVA
jgi:hypothetical protein